MFSYIYEIYNLLFSSMIHIYNSILKTVLPLYDIFKLSLTWEECGCKWISWKINPLAIKYILRGDYCSIYFFYLNDHKFLNDEHYFTLSSYYYEVYMWILFSEQFFRYIKTRTSYISFRLDDYDVTFVLDQHA